MAVAMVLGAAVVLGGCRPGRLRPALPATLPTADRLLAAVAARRQALNAVRGLAHISYERGAEHGGTRHVVVLLPPDRFRLEALSPLGAVAVVTCDGHELAVWVRRERRIYRGAATATSVAAYTGLPLEVRDVVSVLLGLPPERRVIGRPVVERDAEGRVLLRAPIEGGRQDVWFAADTLAPVASETTLDGERVLRVDVDGYRTNGGLLFPLAIDMRLLPDGGRVTVRWEPPTIGGAVAPDLFVFPPRVDAEEVRLDRYPAGAQW